MNEIPRFMIAAPSSGSGKTLLTCGIMRLLQKEGYSVQAFKCGPDYIDPMFHTKVLGISSVNLDSFFVEAPMLRYLFCRRMKNLQADSKIAVIEGVMGYYDGLAGKSAEASCQNDPERTADRHFSVHQSRALPALPCERTTAA